MIVSPIVALMFAELIGDMRKYVFVFETLGIWAFAYYWWTKSRELGRSGAELLAVQGKIELIAATPARRQPDQPGTDLTAAPR